MLSRFVATLLLFIALPLALFAQDDAWTLERCIQYAIDHNISIQQDVLNKRLAEYTLKQSQLAQIPSLNVTPSYGRSFGRSVNPTTNQFVDGGYDFVGLTGNANVLLFGWFQQRNSISKNKYSVKAAQADLDQLKNDVSLNVANGFLRVLLAEEQIHTSEKQVDLSRAQLDQTRRFAEAGRLPELNVAQLESQLATDSSNLITAITTYTAAILDLKTLLNIDFTAPFNIQAPAINIIDQLSLPDMQPEQIYQQAHKNYGAVIASAFRVKSARKGLDASKGALYPQLTLSAQAGSNWASNFLNYQQATQQGPDIVIGHFTDADGIIHNIYGPSYNVITTSSAFSFGDQLKGNFRQTVSLNLNIPIFNGWQSQYAVRQSLINYETQQLNQDQAELTLKQNVYKAYNDAVGSLQKYSAAERASLAAQRAADFAQKRYDLGLTSTVDLLVTQNSSYSAASNLLSAKYDLIFKLKVIDYYLGKELKL